MRPRLTLKHIPELRFILDESIAKADYITDIMDHLDADIPVGRRSDHNQKTKKVPGL